jgi:coatomer subunit beta'
MYLIPFSNGKLIWAKNLEIFSANLKALNTNDEEAIKDGEKITIQPKDLGSCDIFPIVSSFIYIYNYFI